VVKLTLKQANAIHGGLSSPSKMPGKATGLPAAACPTGARLAAAGINGPCTDCYALKNFYAMPGTQAAQARRLAALTDPRWIGAMVASVARQAWFRWHDSGDVQDTAHAMRILDVVRQTPSTRHWLPTQEWGIFRRLVRRGVTIPTNLMVRFSARRYGDKPRYNVWAHWSSVVTPAAWDTLRAANAAGSTADGFACPSHDQGNACGDCRACWDPAVPHVVYRKH